MAELEPNWAEANEFFQRGRVNSQEALDTLKQRGWSLDLLKSDSQPTVIGGLYLTEGETVERKIRRKLLFTSNNKGNIFVNCELFTLDPKLSEEIEQEKRMGRLRTEYPLGHYLRGFEIFDQDVYLSGDEDGELGISTSRLVLHQKGGVSLSVDFVLDIRQPQTPLAVST